MGFPKSNRALFWLVVIVGVPPLGVGNDRDGERGWKNADHWSFQPLRQVSPPGSGETHPIDAFVSRKLVKEGLTPNGPASRRELIRRLTFDLHGLPPTPGEVIDFLDDPASDAVATERVIDRLLASPRYGERWARHWLDVARYSESQGFERDKFRPNSWPYRDYVIASLNADKPYDRFAREQVAGDVMEPVAEEGIVATGFLVAGPWDEVGNSQKSVAMKAIVREEELEDLVSAIGQTFLGVTVNCARCHDHKFDPIPARDYFAFKAVFEAIRHGERFRLGPAERAELREKTEPLQARLAEVEQAIREKSSRDLVSERDRLKEEIAILDPKVYAANARGNDPTHFLDRGDPKRKGDIVPAGGLSILGGNLGLAPEAGEAEQRLAFARWMTSDSNPLFARTMVNRVWHYHFGQGLVTTPNDLGVSGGDPSHPDLLDWMAAEFIRRGWSLKQLHRLILTSATWQRSADHHSGNASIDVENRYLWRFAPRRLEAEAVRDAMLAISGELNPRMGGPSDEPFELLIDNTHFFTFQDRAEPEFNRRTIYRAQIASLRDSLLDSLDCPSIGLKTPDRGVTSTPVQALSLMNNSFVDRQSRKLAAHLEAAYPGDAEAQVREAFALVMGRAPTEEEARAALETRDAQSMVEVNWALFNSTEFIFVR